MAYVYFRGKPTCKHMKAWLEAYQAELLRQGLLKSHLDIWQLVGGASASAGTHRTPGAADTAQVSTAQLKVARQMGAGACKRTKAQGFDLEHCHLMINCPCNGSSRYQWNAINDGYSGLGAGGRGSRDDGPRAGIKFPLIDWDEGIAWAKAQQAPKFTKRVSTYVVTDAPAYGRASYGLKAATKTPARPKGWTFKSKGWVKFEGVLYIQGADGFWYHGPSFDLVKPKPTPPKVRTTTSVGTYNPSDKLGNDVARAEGIAAYLIDPSADVDVWHMQELTGISNGKSSAFSRQIRSAIDGLDMRWRAVIPTTAWNENYFFYRSDRVRLVKRLEDLVIRVPGAEGKHATLAIFADRETGAKTLHVNTHLDPRNSTAGTKARQAQGQVIADHIEALRKVETFDHVVIAGDMNQGQSITAFTKIGLTSVRPRAKKKTNAEYASFQGTGTTPKKGVPIDHIYVEKDATVDEYELMLHLVGGKFPTPKPGDHQPVRTHVTYPAA